MTERPHYIDWGNGPEPASTEEIAPIIVQHRNHNGIACFPDCSECQAARARGEYEHWFPDEREVRP